MAIIQNKPNMNYGVWGSNGNIAVPTSEKVDLGWIIERPPNEVMNWLQNRQDSMLQFINQRGIPTWDALTEYPLGAYVVRSGTLYKAISQNIDKDPTLNSAIWNVAFATYTDYSNLYNDVQNIKGVDGYLDLYVSKNNPVLLAEAKGVGYKDLTGVSGLSFTGTTAQIEKDGNVVVEFSGGNNPKDVVTIEMLGELLKVKVGDLYTTTVNENPSSRLGYGIWERFAEGRTLVGFNSSVSNLAPEWVKTNGAEFGEYSHKQTVDEMPKHKHEVGQLGYQYTFPESYRIFGASDGLSGDGIIDQLAYRGTTEVGESTPFNVVQPSKVVFIWRRTA